MQKILVTGANGQLGNELQELTKGNNNYIFTDIAQNDCIKKLDICNPTEVESFMIEHNIGGIINCAGYTNVDGAESNVELCYKINADGVETLAKAARLHDAFMVHISTDYVFGGTRKRGTYKESATCHPDSVYGASKRKGEIALRRSHCRGIIIRTAWLYSTYGNNFVKTMRRLGATKPSIGVVSDQIGSPTYARDLAAAILKIVPQIGDRRGEIFHFTNEGKCSWFEFAAAIMVYSGLDCKVNPLTTDEYPSAARRPAYSVLDKSKIRETFGVSTPWWSSALQECISKM